MPGSAIYTPKIVPRSTQVRELARANDIISKVSRESRSSDKALKKACERATKALNGIIVDMLKGERDE